MTITACTEAHFDSVLAIVNDGASAYRGVIPQDRWHEPYMSGAALREEIAAGVRFSSYHDRDLAVGVMGIQDVHEVTLIRHAYVRRTHWRRGVGGALLRHLLEEIERPLLVGTWAAAGWAIDFYRKHGFALTSREETERLLRRYWSIPARQVETSVVLRLSDTRPPSH